MAMTPNVTDIAASPVKVMEPASSPSKVTALSPAQLQSSPMKVATPLRSPRVATPVRGRKRTASIASLSQADAPEKVPFLDRFQEHDEEIAKADETNAPDVSFDSLETYKKQTDSVTDVPAPSVEYSDWKEETVPLDGQYDRSAYSMEQTEDARPLEVTVGWQDASTGVMMGYLLCDDSSTDLQAAREICREGDEPEDDSEASMSEDSITEDSESQASGSDYTGTPQKTSDCHSPSQERDVDTSVVMETRHDVPGGLERCDEENNTVLAYALCDGTFESEAILAGAISADELVQEVFEYEDELTGAAVGYGVCDEFFEEEAVQLGLICEGDWVQSAPDAAEVSDACLADEHAKLP